MDLKKLLVKTCEIFDKLRIRYVLIGGYAGIIYGSPYTTADIDFVVIANDVKLDLVDNLKRIGWIPTENYSDVEELRSFGQFYYTGTGYPLHILPEVYGFKIEKGIKVRSIKIDGYPIKVCSLEDFIVMRLAVWGDEDKIKAIAVYKANKMNMRYLKKRAEEEGLMKRLSWLIKKLKEE